MRKKACVSVDMKNQMIQKIFKNRASVSCLVFIAANLILNPTPLKSDKPGNNFIKKIEGRASHFKWPARNNNQNNNTHQC